MTLTRAKRQAAHGKPALVVTKNRPATLVALCANALVETTGSDLMASVAERRLRSCVKGHGGSHVGNPIFIGVLQSSAVPTVQKENDDLARHPASAQH